MTPAEKLAAKRAATPPARKPTQPIKLLCNLKRKRKELGLTLYDVADALGTTHVSVLRAERGEKVCLTTALRLAEFYGVSVNDIWKLK